MMITWSSDYAANAAGWAATWTANTGQHIE
jgi:hypothetical protein